MKYILFTILFLISSSTIKSQDVEDYFYQLGETSRLDFQLLPSYKDVNFFKFEGDTLLKTESFTDKKVKLFSYLQQIRMKDNVVYVIKELSSTVTGQELKDKISKPILKAPKYGKTVMWQYDEDGITSKYKTSFVILSVGIDEVLRDIETIKLEVTYIKAGKEVAPSETQYWCGGIGLTLVIGNDGKIKYSNSILDSLDYSVEEWHD